MFKDDCQPATITAKVTLRKSPANLPKGAGYRKALEILRETGQAFTAMELAHLALEHLGREPIEPVITMLAKTVHSSFSRQKNLVVIYDRAHRVGRANGDYGDQTTSRNPPFGGLG